MGFSGKPILTLKFSGATPIKKVSHWVSRIREEKAEKVREDRLGTFRAAAYSGVHWVAEHATEFTTDDVWEYLALFQASPTPEPRVLGNVMRLAQRERLIEATDEYRRSRRKVNHGRAIRVWKSKVYGNNG
jgi:hypothetical protein